MSTQQFIQAYKIIRIVFFVFVQIGLLGWLLAFLAQVVVSLKKYKTKGMLLILPAIISGLGMSYMSSCVEVRILEDYIQILKQPTTSIMQEDATFGQHSSDDWKAILTQERTPDIGHSGSTDCTNLTVKSAKKKFKVRLCRDSHMPNKYWTFSTLYDMEDGECDTGQIINDDLK